MNAFTKTVPIGVLLAATAGAAQADVTAEEVWQDWRALALQMGETEIETGTEEMSGDRLTVTDLVLTMRGEDGALTARIPEITFVETGTGAVEVTLPARYPLRITGTEDGVSTAIDLAVEQAGLEVTVSGDPGAMRYDYAAQRYALVLEGLQENGAMRPAEGRLALNGLVGSYLTETEATLRRTAFDIAAETMELSLEGEDAEEGAAFSIEAGLAGISLDGFLALPEDMAVDETGMPEDFELRIDYATGPALVEFEGEDAQGAASGVARTASSAVNLSLDPARGAYASSTKGLTLRLTESPLPFPVEVTVAEYGFGLDMPIAADPAAQDFSASVTLDRLTLGDPVWALFDPAAVLPRDPATLIAEFAGTARLPQDLTDPDTAEAVEEEAAMAEAAPELESLTLERLVLRLAGAEMLGDGDFTFDNTDFESFEGFPRPEGKIELKIAGLKALMENLSKLGAIPSENLMGMRMMLGLFTTPVGEDELSAVIEVNEEGHVLANGQRIR